MQSLLWPLVLLLVAVLLVFLEIFVPSSGLISLFAALALFASIGLAFSQSLTDGAIVLLIDLIVLPLVIGLALKIWPHTPLGKLILLKRSDDDVLPETEDYHLREKMIGRHGIAKTVLLPSGDVEIDGQVYDAISDGVPIDPQTPVRVVAVRTRRLVVRPLSDKERAELSAAPDGDDDILSTPIDSLGIDAIDDPLA